jgi:para-nitrobenzyl esterase
MVSLGRNAGSPRKAAAEGGRFAKTRLDTRGLTGCSVLGHVSETQFTALLCVCCGNLSVLAGKRCLMVYSNRRGLLIGALAGAPMLWLPGRVNGSVSLGPVVETGSGKVQGLYREGIDVFRGIPYAGSASGSNRFRAPSAVTPWSGIRRALLPGPPSIQPPGAVYGIGEPGPSEDCLSLTIWTPGVDKAARPVMFYSHGGGFTTGSGSSIFQDGAHLAREQDVVVVATNHRLGLLGYLYLDDVAGEDYAGSGNNGLRDIVAALEWVHENIEAFGGDPRNVMIFGESGGGAKTSCLYAMPSAAPYFGKASIESGPGVRMTTLDVARETTDRVFQHLGIAKSQWRRLLEVPAETLLACQTKLGAQTKADPLAGDRCGVGAAQPGGFAPVVDGTVLLNHPFDPVAPAISREKPLICGYNHDEYAFIGMIKRDAAMFNLDEAGLLDRLRGEMPDDYREVIQTYRESRPQASPADVYIAIRTARFAGAGSILIAERKAAQKAAPIYSYIFNYQLERAIAGTSHPLGAMHALDIAFKFNNVSNAARPGGTNLAGERPERISAGRNMSGLWASFARTGVPSSPDLTGWPAYDVERRETMIIDATCRLERDPTRLERLFWEARSETCGSQVGKPS